MTGPEFIAYLIASVIFIAIFGSWYFFVEYVTKKMEWDPFALGAITVVLFEVFMKLVIR